MKITQRHFDILKDYLDMKINPEDIAEEDKKIILELCKLRKKGSWERKKKFFLSTNFPFVSDSKIINSICQNK